MKRPLRASYDIAIVGAGPVGSFCALVHAQRGARVALLEANLKSSRRLAGEWLHPPAVRMLRDAGIRFEDEPDSSTGSGFVVLPEAGAEPIVLPYRAGTNAVTCDHATIVSKLREAAEREAGVDFLSGARVRAVGDGEIIYTHHRQTHALRASRVVGADGRASVVRQSLGLATERTTCSRMVGLLLRDVELPYAGCGHVLLGAPGPILMYGLGERCVRVMADVPMQHWVPRYRAAFLAERYAPLLPETLRAAFVEALQDKRTVFAANEIRSRASYGTADRVLIGDAAGNYHPMTAVGLTLGFGDALALAESEDFDGFVAGRLRATRAPELLAMGLYEVFADHRPESVALRQAVFRRWRASGKVRTGTVAMLACEETSMRRLGLTFAGLVVRAAARTVPATFDKRAWRRARDTNRAFVARLAWFLRGARRQGRLKASIAANGAGGETQGHVRDALARAFLHSLPPEGGSPAAPQLGPESLDVDSGVRRGAARLVELQGEDGGWEAELGWCPMLTAQYVLVHHIVGRPIEPSRRRRLLHYFRSVRVDGGLWGFHAVSPPHLFVTALVYVAARLLGVAPGDPLVEPARRFIRSVGIANIPTWGKVWLALVNLYDWRGVNPILPELWRLPRWLPLHPSNWYCHARHIYSGMAFLYAHRFSAPATPTIAALREELFEGGFDRIDFPATRNRLRDEDLYARPTVWLRGGYAFARLFERLHGKGLRARCLAKIVEQIRWELKGTDNAGLSPLDGVFNVLALWLTDRNDDAIPAALARMEHWLWDDEQSGTRVAMQRTATWDTSFALQALAAVSNLDGVGAALNKGASYLKSEQIPGIFNEAPEAEGNGARAGWCLGPRWHGLPVYDVTAEALLAIVAADGDAVDAELVGKAVRFVLSGQNADGGFGCYEPRGTPVSLEWLNPSEMFAGMMTDESLTECTASCAVALALCRERFGAVADADLAQAIAGAEAWLRRAQASDGSWRGTWGINFIYGTFFGVKGLVAAGAGADDPALRQSCQWLLERQQEDGGWGEHHTSCRTGRYVPHTESQVVQTAWALIALLEAGDSNWNAISRGVGFLLDKQDRNGNWPKQDPAGVYGRTALLEYPLYRQYFPLHALGLYEQRRRAQLG